MRRSQTRKTELAQVILVLDRLLLEFDFVLSTSARQDCHDSPVCSLVLTSSCMKYLWVVGSPANGRKQTGRRTNLEGGDSLR